MFRWISASRLHVALAMLFFILLLPITIFVSDAIPISFFGPIGALWEIPVALVSMIGTISTAILAWRADRRAVEESALKMIQMHQQIAELQLKLSASQKPKLPGNSDSSLPPCIFCNNESGSEEHLWPNWIHRFMKENGINLGALRVQEGSEPETIEEDLEKKVNTVCHPCNNGWMSEIEGKNKPRLKTMLQKLPLTIDPGGMKILTEWTVKTARVLDSIKPRIGNENFYTRKERVAMREKLQIPARTRIWIGALDEFHLGCHGTDFTVLADARKTRIGTGCANTIYTGYFVVQVVTEHIYPAYQANDIPEIQPPAGISDSRLVQIYPKGPKKIEWPTVPFTNGGPNGIGHLLFRWCQGEKVLKVTRDGVEK